MDEVSHVLQTKEFHLSDEDVRSLLLVAAKCMTVRENVSATEVQEYSRRLKDQKDIPVLAGFERYGCDALVTGDKELLKKVPKAKTTRQALKMLLIKS
jgi:predicted nucleic acid-binding protein